MKKLFFKKIIPLLLVISIITPSFFLSLPTKAKATWPVWDYGNSVINEILTTTQTAALIAADTARYALDQSLTWMQRLLAAVAKLFARALIMTITQSIVNWINSGFQGSPSFMTNPAGMLRNAADQAIGEYILAGPLNFLCEPFQLQVKLNLGLQFGGYGNGISCTLTGVLGNIQGAYDDFVGGDFIGGGGWDSWMQMASNPQNTPQGAAMMAEGALEVKIAGMEDIMIKEIDWGGGSLSLKKCKEATFEVKDDPSPGGGKSRTLMGARTFVGHPGYATGTSISATHESVANDTGGNTIVNQEKETSCETTTPGAVIMDTMKLTETSWLRTLELDSTIADSINAIIGAFATLAVKTTLNKVMGGMFGGEEDNTDYRGQMLNQLDQFKNDEANKRLQGIEPDTKNVDNATDFETRNVENFNLAITTLNSVKQVVSGSIICTDLTTNLIKANVTDNIDGIANSLRTKPNVYFNLPYLNSLASTSNSKIKKLNEIKALILNIGAINAQERNDNAFSEIKGETGTTTITTVEMLNSKVNLVMVGSESYPKINKDISEWLNAELVDPKTSYAMSPCRKDIKKEISNILKPLITAKKSIEDLQEQYKLETERQSSPLPVD
jgi:hypothetical protein